MSVHSLIDKAAKAVGNRHKLAKILQCTVSQVYDWHSGTKKCSAADRARLANLAGEDALQELVRATLEETEGTPRGDQLMRVLGKSSRQTGAALHSVMLALGTFAYGMAWSVGTDVLRCINRQSKLC